MPAINPHAALPAVILPIEKLVEPVYSVLKPLDALIEEHPIGTTILVTFVAAIVFGFTDWTSKLLLPYQIQGYFKQATSFTTGAFQLAVAIKALDSLCAKGP